MNALNWTCLNEAADHGHIEIVKYLLDRGADIETPSVGGWSPLLSAAESGHSDIVKLLLDRGAIRDKRTEDEFTALYASCQKGHINTVRLLLDRGGRAELNVGNKHAWMPVHVAAFNGHTEIVQLLIESGCDIHGASNIGQTPLHLSSKKGHVGVMQLLNDNGAELNSRSKSNGTSTATCSFLPPEDFSFQVSPALVV
jgi:ankyrin repeat protein